MLTLEAIFDAKASRGSNLAEYFDLKLLISLEQEAGFKGALRYFGHLSKCAALQGAGKASSTMNSHKARLALAKN